MTISIPYEIIRSNRKTYEIQVNEDGIKIRAPIHMTDKEILEILISKQEWIDKKYLEYQTKPKKFRKRFDRSYIRQRMEELASIIGVRPSKLVIKPLKTMWGSASSDAAITINSRILKAPKGVIDYVLIHELCHLKIPNHSNAYWELVETYTKL